MYIYNFSYICKNLDKTNSFFNRETYSYSFLCVHLHTIALREENQAGEKKNCGTKLDRI